MHALTLGSRRTLGLGLALVVTLAPSCSSFVNIQAFVYEVDGWTLNEDTGKAVHRRFIDDQDQPEGWEFLDWGYFMAQAGPGAIRRELVFEGAHVVNPELELGWDDLWTGEFELWAITESGLELQLGWAQPPAGGKLSKFLSFEVLAAGDLRDISSDFGAGEFDVELRTTPIVEAGRLPSLELHLLFASDARVPRN